MVEKRKTYIGTFRADEEAARLYDRYAIYTNGIHAKTNFRYWKRDVVYILNYFIAL